MAKIERTEYETVENSVEVTVCDCCNVETDNTVQLSLNPESRSKESYEILEFAAEPDGLDIPDTAFDPPEYSVTTSRDRVCHYGPNQIIHDDGHIELDYGWMTRGKHTTELDGATETFDVCIGCLREQLGADIPEEYESIEIDSDGIEVTKKTYNPLGKFHIEDPRFTTVMVIGFSVAAFMMGAALL